jgi:hypothetical protein
LKTGTELLNSTILFLQRSGMANPSVGPPEQFAGASRSFWKVRLDSPVNNVFSHVTEAVTIEKNYFILFVFTSPDTSKLDEVQATINSSRFVDPTRWSPAVRITAKSQTACSQVYGFAVAWVAAGGVR